MRRRRSLWSSVTTRWYFWFLGGFLSFALGMLTDAAITYRDLDNGCRTRGYAWAAGWTVVCVEVGIDASN